MDEQLWKRISLDPRTMTGKPVIRGTRIPVELIVWMLAEGIPRAALAYAAQALAYEDVFSLAVPA